ncbi:MAG: electron transfer flavoprotein subunit alpha, partial [Prevotellaceae bacterium]|nr:electron transfer flavoprotein subunit alpha [Prevotellaceae bacterium]
MNNILVYCEIENGKIADVSLELLTKGRGLAAQLGCRIEALAIGEKLAGIETELARYGADIVHLADDARLWPFRTLPHAAITIGVIKEEQPQIAL